MADTTNSFKNPNSKGPNLGISGTPKDDFKSPYGGGNMSFGAPPPTPPPSPATSNEMLQARGVSPGKPSGWQDGNKAT